MAAADKFVQQSGDPGANIDADDINIVKYVIQGELADKIDPRWAFSTTGEFSTGSSLFDTTVMPWVEVWVSEIADERTFCQITHAGHWLEDSDGFMGPPSAYDFHVQNDSSSGFWYVTVMHGGLFDEASTVNDFQLDPGHKRILWIHATGIAP